MDDKVLYLKPHAWQVKKYYLVCSPCMRLLLIVNSIRTIIFLPFEAKGKRRRERNKLCGRKRYGEKGAYTLKSIFQMMDSLLRALGFVPLSAPFVRTSQAESQWFLVQLSAPGVSLVCSEPSYKHSACTPHILLDGPSGQSMNFWAIIFGCLGKKNAQLSWLILKAKFTHSVWKLLPAVQIAAQPLISQTLLTLSLAL